MTQKKVLCIIYELEKEELNNTVGFIKNNFPDYEDVRTCHADELNKLISQGTEIEIVTLHLSLDNEIETHKRVSAFAQKHSIRELNPYSELAEIADNKYMFYLLMLANGIKQAKTINSEINSRIKSKLKETIETLQVNQIVIKPCHGTEGHDFRMFNTELLENNSEIFSHLNKILEYDDALIQEFIDCEREFKIVIFKDKIFANLDLERFLKTEKLIELRKLICEAKDILDGKAQLKTELISFDVLETATGFILLEANARPAGIFKFHCSLTIFETLRKQFT